MTTQIITPATLSTEISNRLEELTVTRPLIIPSTGSKTITITVDDFRKIATWHTMGDVLADPILTECVVTYLTAIANERLLLITK